MKRKISTNLINNFINKKENMYIRRKVYSVLTDDCGQERLFSTNEVYLDDCEDDRLFAERERGLKDAAKGAGVGLGVAGLGAGTAWGLKKLAEREGNIGALAGKAKGAVSKVANGAVNKVFRGNKNAAIAAAIGIPTLAAAGLAYLKGHKKKTNDNEEGEKSFSKMEDEDYIEDIKKGAKVKKDFQKLVRKGKATAGGILGLGGGMTAGALLAERLGPGAVPIGAAGGAVIGSLIGNRLGKKQQNKKEKAIDEKLQRDLDRYNNASEKDKKYLRERIKSEALKNAIISASPYTSQVEGEEDD